MQVFIDADGCPVTNIALEICKKQGVACTLVCDTAHEFYREGARTLVVDKGADSADFALVNRISAVDIVVTQDYGLASMCLAKKAVVIHQDGWLYTPLNIDALLLQRHESKKYRNAGGRLKGPHKRQAAQDEAFRQAFQKLFQG